MKRLPLESPRKNRYQSTDTLTLIWQLGFQSVGPGHWVNRDGSQEIYECGKEREQPFSLRIGNEVTYHPSLIAVYQELTKPETKGAS